jgi:hypothetical protein
MTIPVYYREEMVANAQSFSPSAGKPREVVASWRRRFGAALEIVAPAPATPQLLALAHDPDYVRGVLAGTIDNGFGNRLPEVAAALPYTSGAMVAAAEHALRDGSVAVAPVSGFHHACHEHGGGYCTFNGLIVAAQALRTRHDTRCVGILDFDQHYGNGTADIIRRLKLDWIEHYTAEPDWDRPEQAEDFLAAIPGLMKRFAGCDVLCTRPVRIHTLPIRLAAGSPPRSCASATVSSLRDAGRWACRWRGISRAVIRIRCARYSTSTTTRCWNALSRLPD